jgi:hypothetical protein
MSHDLNGLWLSEGDGGIYYVSHYLDKVWFAGLSNDGQFYNGLKYCHVFSGRMDANGLITGRWVDVPRGVATNGGSLELQVIYDSDGNAITFIRVTVSGGLTGENWVPFDLQEEHKAPEIYDVFKKVKKNQTLVLRGHQTLENNLKPCKVFPVVVFGGLFDRRLVVNYPPNKTGTSYKDFICLGNDKADGDIDFDLHTNEGLMTRDFWTEGWQINNGVNSANFGAKLRYHNYKLHCEAIMYGKTAECGDDEHYDDLPLLPGWADDGGNSVLINGLPIEGHLNSDPRNENSSFINGIGIKQLPTYQDDTLVRVTGILVLDCGHGSTDPCDEDDPSVDNVEIHPVIAIDIITSTKQDNLTGVWADQDGLTYYIRHVKSEIWWLAMSPALDYRCASAFYGTISEDGKQIQGILVNLPLGTNFRIHNNQSVFNIPPRSCHLFVDEDRLTLQLPDGTYLLKLYDRDPGQVDPPPPTPISEAEVLAKLEELAKANPTKLDWKVSIVDLLVLLNLDSSFKTRQEMAVKLGCPAELMADSAKMNVFLHQTILKEIAQNGGNLPPELLDYSV